jgi:chloramphenicol-sensitive protein RarD
VLLSVNWLIYIWAVNNGHVIEASLGYFINPLVNIMLGYLLLKERLRPAQWMAIAWRRWAWPG